MVVHITAQEVVERMNLLLRPPSIDKQVDKSTSRQVGVMNLSEKRLRPSTALQKTLCQIATQQTCRLFIALNEWSVSMLHPSASLQHCYLVQCVGIALSKRISHEEELDSNELDYRE